MSAFCLKWGVNHFSRRSAAWDSRISVRFLIKKHAKSKDDFSNHKMSSKKSEKNHGSYFHQRDPGSRCAKQFGHKGVFWNALVLTGVTIVTIVTKYCHNRHKRHKRHNEFQVSMVLQKWLVMFVTFVTIVTVLCGDCDDCDMAPKIKTAWSFMTFVTLVTLVTIKMNEF